MSDGTANRNELGAFLKARRAELSPDAVGLPDTGTPRRVPGLRREEVAQLVAISTDYYTRIEQGRIRASGPVLDAIGRVLSLDETQTAYLLGLAGRTSDRPRRRAPQRLHPQMRRLLDQLTESPALVVGRHHDILGWNPLAAALIADFGAIPEQRRNYMRMMFTDPDVQGLFPDWQSVGRMCVASLRLEAAQFPDDPRLASLVGELSMKNADFREWWAARHVQSAATGTKTFRHPVAGDMALDWQTLACPADPEQHLTIYSAEPGTPAHQALRFLASWAAEHVEAPAAGAAD
ncbi:helix-turn-helix transcriptional regulator [Patulibacter sp. NPDC049589]|uniref:helix-turn-helix domain-containing protein n=1 Tax=Patulibacter sp. NPDC049589 TaxID=3154731 RepID=UPI00343EB4C4